MRSLFLFALVIICAHAMPQFPAKGKPVGGHIEDEIKKLAEEAITKVITEVVPNTVDLVETHNLSKTVNVPAIGTVSFDISFNGTQMTQIDHADKTDFGNFTESAVNVTITFPNTIIISNASGTVDVVDKNFTNDYQLKMTVPLTLEAEVTYKLKKVFGVPVALDGVPCLGPVLKSSLGTADVTGFGWLNKYLTEAANKAISEQHLFEKPLDEAINEVLKKVEYKCNFTSSSNVVVENAAMVGSGFTDLPDGVHCKTDADCPCSYCKNDKTKTAPFLCQAAKPGICCKTDADCKVNDPASYCETYKPQSGTQSLPWRCHGN